MQFCGEEGHVCQDCPQSYANVQKSKNEERNAETPASSSPILLVTSCPTAETKKGAEKVQEREGIEGKDPSRKENLIRKQENVAALSQMVAGLGKKEGEKDFTKELERIDKRRERKGKCELPKRGPGKDPRS